MRTAICHISSAHLQSDQRLRCTSEEALLPLLRGAKHADEQAILSLSCADVVFILQCLRLFKNFIDAALLSHAI